MIKKILMMLIAIFLLVSVSFAEEMYIFCKPETVVNIRSKPSGKVQAWIECGTKVDTDGKQRRIGGKVWIHVVDLAAEDSQGWICSDYLSDTPINVETREAHSCAEGKLAVRKRPNGKVIAWLKNCEKTMVIADNGEWAITETGYVKMEYLEFVEILEDE